MEKIKLYNVEIEYEYNYTPQYSYYRDLDLNETMNLFSIYSKNHKILKYTIREVG